MGSSSPWLEIGRHTSVQDGQKKQCARSREIRLFRPPIGRMVSCVSMLQSNCCCKTVFSLEVKEMLVAAVIGYQAHVGAFGGGEGEATFARWYHKWPTASEKLKFSILT